MNINVFVDKHLYIYLWCMHIFERCMAVESYTTTIICYMLQYEETSSTSNTSLPIFLVKYSSFMTKHIENNHNYHPLSV